MSRMSVAGVLSVVIVGSLKNQMSLYLLASDLNGS